MAAYTEGIGEMHTIMRSPDCSDPLCVRPVPAPGQGGLVGLSGRPQLTACGSSLALPGARTTSKVAPVLQSRIFVPVTRPAKLG